MLLTRYLQHLRCGRSWNTLFGKKGVRGLGKLYPEMFKRGPHTFGIIPIEFVSRAAADSREQFWIRKLGKCLNVRMIPPTTRKWKLLFQGKLVTPRYTKGEIAHLVNTIASTIHCNIPMHTQVRLLTTAQKHLSGPARNRCYQKVALRVKRLTGLTLPNTAPLKVPCLRGMESLQLLPLLKECIGGLPIPAYYKAYIKSVCRVSVVRNPTVGDLLSNRVKPENLNVARLLATSHCDCHRLSKELDIPLVDGHGFLRHPVLIKRVFGPHGKILLQNGKNDVIPAWWNVKSTVIQSLRTLMKKVLPEPPPTWQASSIYNTILSRVRVGHSASRASSPWFLRQDTIEAFHRQWSEQWVFSGCDKNTGKLSAHCRSGQLLQELKELGDVKQFEVVYIAPSAKDAKAHAMQLLYNQATLHGQKPFWISRASKSPPSVRFLPKNKLNELQHRGRTPQRFALHGLPTDLWLLYILPSLGCDPPGCSLCSLQTSVCLPSPSEHG